ERNAPAIAEEGIVRVAHEQARSQEDRARQDEGESGAELREDPVEAASLLRRVLGREERRTCPLAAHGGSLGGAEYDQGDQRGDADGRGSRQQADEDRRNTREQKRRDQRPLAAEPVAVVADGILDIASAVA